MNDICTHFGKTKPVLKKKMTHLWECLSLEHKAWLHSDEILHLSDAQQRNRIIMQLMSSQVRQKREVGNTAASVNMYTLKIWEACASMRGVSIFHHTDCKSVVGLLAVEIIITSCSQVTFFYLFGTLANLRQNLLPHPPFFLLYSPCWTLNSAPWLEASLTSVTDRSLILWLPGCSTVSGPKPEALWDSLLCSSVSSQTVKRSLQTCKCQQLSIKIDPAAAPRSTVESKGQD